jgi:hypothetical protein
VPVRDDQGAVPGLAKNANHLFAALALVNLVMVKRRLLQT